MLDILRRCNPSVSPKPGNGPVRVKGYRGRYLDFRHLMEKSLYTFHDSTPNNFQSQWDYILKVRMYTTDRPWKCNCCILKPVRFLQKPCSRNIETAIHFRRLLDMPWVGCLLRQRRTQKLPGLFFLLYQH